MTNSSLSDKRIIQDDEIFSFSGVLGIWILFSFFGDRILYFLIEVMLPFDKPGYSFLQVFILRILFLGAFPISMVSLVIPLLPFQKIDFSRESIKQSLEHKLLFLCTSPIILLGYLFAKKVSFWINSVFVAGFGFFFYLLLIWMTIMIWISFYLRIWSLLRVDNTSNTSNTLQKLRKSPRYTNFDDYAKFSLRYISFMCGLPILLMMLGVILDPNGNFVFGLFVSLGADVFAFFFSLSFLKNYLIQQDHQLNSLNQISNRLFGDK